MANLRLLCPVTGRLAEEASPHVATTFFQVVVEGRTLSLLCSRLNSLSCSSSHLCFLHQLCSPALDTLQHLCVPELRGPEMNTQFKVQPHPCQIEGEKSRPWSCWPQYCRYRPRCHQPFCPPGHTPTHVQLLLTSAGLW